MPHAIAAQRQSTTSFWSEFGLPVILLLLTASGALAFIYADMGGYFAHEVPVVEKALDATDVRQQLQANGIASLSRGYEWGKTDPDMLFVHLNDGRTIEIASDSPWGKRKYLIKTAPMFSFAGTSPLPDETRDQFLSVVKEDVALAVTKVARMRAREATASQSWQ